MAKNYWLALSDETFIIIIREILLSIDAIFSLVWYNCCISLTGVSLIKNTFNNLFSGDKYQNKLVQPQIAPVNKYKVSL